MNLGEIARNRLHVLSLIAAILALVAVPQASFAAAATQATESSAAAPPRPTVRTELRTPRHGLEVPSAALGSHLVACMIMIQQDETCTFSFEQRDECGDQGWIEL